MNTKQPWALKLADMITLYEPEPETEDLAAAELRRLHAENEVLREFVEYIRRNGDTRLASMAIAALAGAGEVK